MDKLKNFYIDNGGKLFGYLLRKCGNHHLASDLVQETFTRYLERYRDRELNLAILFTIGRNLFYDHTREQGRVVFSEKEAAESAPDQERLYIDREESKRMLRLMQQLTEEERDILAMVAGGGLSYKEIAVVRKCSEANIKVKVHRARKKLRQLLQKS